MSGGLDDELYRYIQDNAPNMLAPRTATAAAAATATATVASVGSATRTTVASVAKRLSARGGDSSGTISTTDVDNDDDNADAEDSADDAALVSPQLSRKRARRGTTAPAQAGLLRQLADTTKSDNAAMVDMTDTMKKSVDLQEQTLEFHKQKEANQHQLGMLQLLVQLKMAGLTSSDLSGMAASLGLNIGKLPV